MSRYARLSSARLWSVLFIGIVATLLTGCASSTRPSSPPKVDPLVKVSCPPLAPLLDDSFGATTSRLADVAATYYRCRAAALTPR